MLRRARQQMGERKRKKGGEGARTGGISRLSCHQATGQRCAGLRNATHGVALCARLARPHGPRLSETAEAMIAAVPRTRLSVHTHTTGRRLIAYRPHGSAVCDGGQPGLPPRWPKDGMGCGVVEVLAW